MKLTYDDVAEFMDPEIMPCLADFFEVVGDTTIYCLHCGGSFNQADVMFERCGREILMVCPIEDCDGGVMDFSMSPWFPCPDEEAPE